MPGAGQRCRRRQSLDSSNAVFTISQSASETVSAPRQPQAQLQALRTTSYFFTSGGSTSSLGHAVQYKIRLG